MDRANGTAALGSGRDSTLASGAAAGDRSGMTSEAIQKHINDAVRAHFDGYTAESMEMMTAFWITLEKTAQRPSLS